MIKEKNTSNKNTIDKKTKSTKIDKIIENQKRAVNWLGKWYWQIQLDKAINNKKRKDRAI